MSDSEKPVIRVAHQNNLDQIVPLFLYSVDTSLPGVTFSNRPGYDVSKIHPHLLKRLFAPSVRTFVLELLSSSEIVGYASIKSDEDVDRKREELDMLFVKAGMTGRGYGGLIMEHLQKEWQDSGLWVHVFKRNERGIGFYRKWGFELHTEDNVSVDGEIEVACFMHWEAPIHVTAPLK